jgi:hypothetical protein
LSGKVYPENFYERKPEEPIKKEYENYFGGESAAGEIIIFLILSAMFFYAGTTIKAAREKVEQENKQAKINYQQKLASYNKALADFNYLKKIEKDPKQDGFYRKKLITEFLGAASENRKYKVLPDGLKNDKRTRYVNFLNKIYSDFPGRARCVSIPTIKTSDYIPLAFLTLNKADVIIDVDKQRLVYSSSEYLQQLLYTDENYDIYSDEFDDYLCNKFYDELRKQNAEFVMNGYIVIKFTNEQLSVQSDNSSLTVKKVLEYLGLFEPSNTTLTEAGSRLKTFEFKNNIFTF